MITKNNYYKKLSRIQISVGLVGMAALHIFKNIQFDIIYYALAVVIFLIVVYFAGSLLFSLDFLAVISDLTLVSCLLFSGVAQSASFTDLMYIGFSVLMGIGIGSTLGSAIINWRKLNCRKSLNPIKFALISETLITIRFIYKIGCILLLIINFAGIYLNIVLQDYFYLLLSLTLSVVIIVPMWFFTRTTERVWRIVEKRYKIRQNNVLDKQ